MTRSVTSAHKLDDVALNRVLSLANAPQVPAGLADQIAATVTQFAQTATPCLPDVRVRSRVRYALAASLAAVGIAGVLALTVYSTVSPDTSPERFTALADPANAGSPVLAVEQRASTEPAPAFATNEAQPAKSVPAIAPMALQPAPGVEIELVDLAENAATANPAPAVSDEAGEPVGPSLAEGADRTATGAEAPLFGPPAPQGLGIRGGGYSTLPDAGLSAPGQPGFPGARNRW